jgi:hypothetical protein
MKELLQAVCVSHSIARTIVVKVDKDFSFPSFPFSDTFRYGVDGFIIVVRFASQEAWFTFHRVQQEGSRVTDK